MNSLLATSKNSNSISEKESVNLELRSLKLLQSRRELYHRNDFERKFKVLSSIYKNFRENKITSLRLIEYENIYEDRITHIIDNKLKTNPNMLITFFKSYSEEVLVELLDIYVNKMIKMNEMGKLDKALNVIFSYGNDLGINNKSIDIPILFGNEKNRKEFLKRVRESPDFNDLSRAIAPYLDK